MIFAARSLGDVNVSLQSNKSQQQLTRSEAQSFTSIREISTSNGHIAIKFTEYTILPRV